MWPRGAGVLTPVICGAVLRCLQRCLASDRGLGAGHPAIQSGCHSTEGDTAARGFLSCLGGGGGTSVSRKKSISDPDQFRLCVTCDCLGGAGGARTIMSMECGRHQIMYSHWER